LSGSWINGLISVDLLQNFTDKFGGLIDRILTAKMINLTRFDEKNKNGFQRKSLKALILLVGRERIELSTY
jgi:hypothetical protein